MPRPRAEGPCQGALIGAAVGGAAGGGYGYYVDTQEAKLRQTLQGTGVQVQRNGDNLTLIMPGNITFASNSADISSSFYPTLNSLVQVFKGSSTRTASTSSAIPTAPVRCS